MATAPHTEPKFEIEHLVNLIVTYTNYSKLEARHIISSILTNQHAHPLSEIIEWCIHIKEVEDAARLINQVIKGESMVQKQSDGKWRAVDHTAKTTA